MKKHIDIVVSELCNEIDYWKERAHYFESLYKEERDDSIRQTNERLEEAKKGVGMALMFALSCSDGPNGELVINKENRKDLAGYLENQS